MSNFFKAVYDLIVAVLVWLRGAFSNGKIGSASRVLSGIVILTWVHIALENGGVPDKTQDVAWLILALYGVASIGGNLKDGIAGLRKEQPAQPPAAPQV